MINGSVLAPFVHDSTWPADALTRFRAAVYYRHVHTPGKDAVSFLRELAKRREKAADSKDMRWKSDWDLLKRISNKTVHLNLTGVKDEEMPTYVDLLLTFANLLLIQEFGYKEKAKIQIQKGQAEDIRKGFLKDIEERLQGLRSILDSVKQQGNDAEVNLKGETALLPIPSRGISVELAPNPTLVLVMGEGKGKDVLNYAFRPHDPIGWELTEGNPEKDKFRDDPMSSPGLLG